jgi:hypothetical protein
VGLGIQVNAKWKLRLTVTVLLGAVVAYALRADVFHVYTLRDDNGGTMLWNANEAYLFMSVQRRGYRFSWPGHAWAILGQWLNAPPPPTDQRTFFVAIHVTPAGAERHVATESADSSIVPHFFTPLGRTIYGFAEGTFYKWSGDHFEPISPMEQEKFGGLDRLSSDSDRSINGWSKIGIGQVAGDAEFSVDLGKETTLKIRQGNVYKTANSATVDLYRTGQPVQELWHVNGDPHRVSKKEYVRALSATAIN